MFIIGKVFNFALEMIIGLKNMKKKHNNEMISQLCNLLGGNVSPLATKKNGNRDSINRFDG